MRRRVMLDMTGTEHDCCWHMCEILSSIPAQVREKCCWCDRKRVNSYTPPAEEHGRFIYR